MIGQFGEPERLGVPDELAEDAVTGGQVTDLGPEVVADADGEELGELLVVADDAQGSVLRVDQDDGGFDNSLQNLGKVELAADGHHGFEEPVEPVPGAAHFVDTDLELFEQFVQPEPRHPRTHGTLIVTAHALPPSGAQGEVRPAFHRIPATAFPRRLEASAGVVRAEMPDVCVRSGEEEGRPAGVRPADVVGRGAVVVVQTDDFAVATRLAHRGTAHHDLVADAGVGTVLERVRLHDDQLLRNACRASRAAAKPLTRAADARARPGHPRGSVSRTDCSGGR